MDDAHPDERIEFILNDSQTKVIIVSDETYERAERLSGGVRLLNISSLIGDDIGALSELDVDYGDLACILYTSGTTGLPKGVKVTRKSVINVVESYIKTYGLDSGDVYGLFSAIGFDVSSFVISAVLCSGACLSIVPEDIRLNMLELNKYFIKQNVSHAFITTQVGKLFMQSVDETSLDVLLVAGEKLGEFESPDDYLLIDAYGPTEAFAFVSSIDNNDKLDGSSVGMLNHNTGAYILDDQQRRVPVGAVGELYLSGYHVADGYLNREEENARAFIENPFSDEEGYDALYRTGDLVRLLPDGSLGIVGHRDSQVKIRGNRLELSEVEAVIREIDYVEDVTVQTIENEGNNELVAYVVVSDDLEDSALRDIIQEYVRGLKPEYMVPSYVMGLDAIPLNVNGKVDRRALPEVVTDDLRAQYVVPSTETERHIVEAFEEVFNQVGIGIYDDFARLGGDSITAIKITSILSRYDIGVNARTIFDNKTPYQIAKVIDESKAEYGFYLAKEGTINQNMFIFPPLGGISMVFSQLIDNLEFEGNVYLIDDFKFDLTIEEVKNTDHKMTFEKYWDAIKDIFQDGDIIVGYSLGCLFSMLIVERLEKDKKIEKCVLIDGPLNFCEHKNMEKEEALSLINELYDLGFDVDDLSIENHDEFIDKMAEIFAINSNWDFPAAKINDTPVIYLATTHDLEGKLENIAKNGEFIFIDNTYHEAIVTKDVQLIVKYLK